MSNFWIGPNSILCKLFGICSKQKPPAPVPPTPVEYVTAWVCPGSGLLANAYCPLAGNMDFKKGTEPTTTCTLHKRSDQSFLVGTSAYQLTDFLLDQIEAFFVKLCQSGGNYTKWFISHSWPHDEGKGRLPTGWEHSHPWKQMIDANGNKVWWTDPKFPGWQFPLFDLDAADCWDADYWTKTYEIFKLLVKYDITALIYFLDACSWGPDKADYKRFCWMDDAVQNGEHGGTMTGGRYEEQKIDAQGHKRVRFYYQKLLDKFFDTALAGNPKLMWGIMNEPNYPSPGQTPIEEQERLILSLHRFIYDRLKEHGVADDHIVICAGQGFARMRADSQLSKCLFELHGIDSPETLTAKLKDWGTNHILVSGDGPDKNARGIQANIGSPTWDPAPSQATAMRTILIDQHIVGWESFGRAIESKWPADITRADFEHIKALCGI